MIERVQSALLESARVKTVVAETMSDQVMAAANLLGKALREGNKLLFCGNGGSAADAQHLAAEFIGRFKFDRQPLPAIALTVDTSALTCIANDYSFEQVFARQVSGLGQPGDVLVAITTSGNSPNVLAAVEAAKAAGMKTIGLTGGTGGKLAPIVDIALTVPSDNTARIQESHICIGHILCDLSEDMVMKG